MENSKRRESTSSSVDSPDNKFTYYFNEQTPNLGNLRDDQQKLIDHIISGSNIQSSLTREEIMKTLSLVAGDLTDEAEKRFKFINFLLAPDELDPNEEYDSTKDYFPAQSYISTIDPELRACKDEDTSLFFPTESSKSQLAAKEICEGCSQKSECLETAIRNNEDGIWGGTSKGDRIKLVKSISTIS